MFHKRFTFGLNERKARQYEKQAHECFPIRHGYTVTCDFDETGMCWFVLITRNTFTYNQEQKKEQT